MNHSNIVGGSTAKRVINCPGSVALVQQMPPQPPSKYATEGTLLHTCMEALMGDSVLSDVIEAYNLNDDQVDKLSYCLRVMDDIDPEQTMRYMQEVRVGFNGVQGLDGVYGHVDLIGRVGDRAIVLDWKFGDGVIVDAEENAQGLFYAAAAMKTEKLSWVFADAKEIEIIIVQPFQTRRWVTSFERVLEFRHQLARAVAESKRADATMAIGDWCRWCTAKPVCPKMTGEIERVVHLKLQTLAPEQVSAALDMADKLESFIAEARKLAFERLEKDMPVPGYKLVAKRATRQWTDEKLAAQRLAELGVADAQMMKTELISPAQAEKVLKKSKLALPDDLVVAVSSGSTLAPESDPRPAVLNVGLHLTAALSKLQ